MTMFPAGAGMNRMTAFSRSLLSHVPRRRGDEPFTWEPLEFFPLCSPQARG